MNLSDAIAYLLRCSDNNGRHWYHGYVWDTPENCPICNGTDYADLACPGSRYGHWSSDNAETAWRCARIDNDTTAGNLDFWMRLTVNDSDTPREHLQDYAIALAGADVDAIVDGYLTCQLWAQHDYSRSACDCHNDGDTETCHNPTLDENYSESDVAPEYVDALRDEIRELVAAHPLAVRMYLNTRGRYESAERCTYARSELFGHDYYLTRERHGAGFWDRGLGELGDYLSDIARHAGSATGLWDNGDGILR